MYGRANVTCEVKYGNVRQQESQAKRTVKNHYKLDHEYNVYHRRGTSTCQSKQELITLWIVGVIFLSLTGCLIPLLIRWVWIEMNDQAMKISPQGAISTNHPNPPQLEQSGRGANPV
jgi:hypothetical protein